MVDTLLTFLNDQWKKTMQVFLSFNKRRQSFSHLFSIPHILMLARAEPYGDLIATAIICFVEPFVKRIFCGYIQ